MTDPRALYARAIEALNSRRWAEAQALCGQIQTQVVDHAGVHFVAGVAALHLDQVPQAIACLQRATELNPGRADYWAQFARALSMAHLQRPSLQAATRGLSLADADAFSLDSLGVVFSTAGDYGQAAAAFRRAVRLSPDHANYRFNLATSCMFHGALDEAEREYDACIRLDPDYWKAYLARSQLRRSRQDQNHIAALESRLASAPPTEEARMYLHLSIAKELEDLGNYSAAFDHYVAGKSAHRLTRAYSVRRDVETFESIERFFDRPQARARGDETREPIFVIGMPRSGTTLVDRILSSHPDVHSAGELNHFGIALHRLHGDRKASLAQLVSSMRGKEIDWRELGRTYLDSTRPATGRTPRFTDKLPHNFLHAGFIAKALPNAKIVCMRRNPMDTCLSNFRQLFNLHSPNYDYSFDILDVGRYYVLFDGLMKHWQRMFPDRILEIEYEALVESQKRATSDLLSFCELPWDDRCLRFERNTTPVSTASAVQVRSPMFRSSMQRWQRYGARLDPLRRLLEDSGVRIDVPDAFPSAG